jgi:hypothetical protein
LRNLLEEAALQEAALTKSWRKLLCGGEQLALRLREGAGKEEAALRNWEGRNSKNICKKTLTLLYYI